MCKKRIIKAELGMKIQEVKIIEGGDAVEIYSVPYDRIAIIKEKNIEEYLKVIEISSLSKKDKIFKYQPRNLDEKIVKKNLFRILDMKIKDFMVFTLDPSLDDNENIIYKEGMEPAIGRSVEWWYKRCHDILPERNSRFGNIDQYYAFLGYLIKYLVVNQKYEIAQAWDAVCDESKNIGHFYDSNIIFNDSSELYEGKMKPTGSDRIGEFTDLGNTSKIVQNNASETGFSIVGGCFDDLSYLCPLSYVNNIDSIKIGTENAVPWIVCDVNKKII